VPGVVKWGIGAIGNFIGDVGIVENVIVGRSGFRPQKDVGRGKGIVLGSACGGKTQIAQFGQAHGIQSGIVTIKAIRTEEIRWDVQRVSA